MSTSVIGYPRIGSLRELKFALEAYFKGEKTEDEIKALAKELRKEHLTTQKMQESNSFPQMISHSTITP